jgi:hypothetical protein
VFPPGSVIAMMHWGGVGRGGGVVLAALVRVVGVVSAGSIRSRGTTFGEGVVGAGGCGDGWGCVGGGGSGSGGRNVDGVSR